MAPIVILDQYYLGISALICLGWQLCFFIGASITQSDKVQCTARTVRKTAGLATRPRSVLLRSFLWLLTKRNHR